MTRRTLFWAGIAGLLLFEAANVYFIMPMPGSQRIRSVDAAYRIYGWRWWARGLFGAALLAGLPDAWRGRRSRPWPLRAFAALAVLAYLLNFQMAADHMFRQVATLRMVPADENTVDGDRLVVGVQVGEDTRAYPIRFLGYHHMVRDRIGSREVIVTYCTVCRTGRVFSPEVEGRLEQFRLVGMDHFNAMFEDGTTGSWWRQANGQAIVGPRKGAQLQEVPSVQVALAEWLVLHPRTFVMQEDLAFADDYAKDSEFEDGTSRKALTGTNPDSWKDKSWIVGISLNGKSKAYDWNRLRVERVVNDAVGGVPIVLVLAADNVSFVAFARPDAASRFEFKDNSLTTAGSSYSLSGQDQTASLTPVQASQEFWHNWRTFHPDTERY